MADDWDADSDWEANLDAITINLEVNTWFIVVMGLDLFRKLTTVSSVLCLSYYRTVGTLAAVRVFSCGYSLFVPLTGAQGAGGGGRRGPH